MNKAKFLKKITITDTKLIEEVKKFAYSCTQTTKETYLKRGTCNDVDKMISDKTYATLAEWAVWQFLCEEGYVLEQPDMKIYQKYEKSHGADLVCDGVEISVKSQDISSVKRNGASFLIMKNSWYKQQYRKVIFALVEGNDFYLFDCGFMDELEIGMPKSIKAQDYKYAFYLQLEQK